MTAARRRCPLRLLMVSLVLVIAAVTSDPSDDDTEDITLDPSLPTSPPVVAMLLTERSSATEVAVHVAERFLPFTSRTTVGVYAPPATTDSAYRVMFSFLAYAFLPVNAATMDCFIIDDDSCTWKSAVPDEASAFYSHGFCVRRDIADDASSFGIAVFRQYNDGPTLVHYASDPTAAVVAQGVLRGWTQPPVAAFRVVNLQQWHVAPSLTLVVNITAISGSADGTDHAVVASLCPLDPLGRVARVFAGGNYYGNVIAMPLTVLCVSYVQRSLHDLHDEDSFFALVRPVPVSGWRFNVCPWGSNEVMDMVTNLYLSLTNSANDSVLLCYNDQTLLDRDDPQSLESTASLLKQITIDETEADVDQRIITEYHEEDAWAFTPREDDVVAINSF